MSSRFCSGHTIALAAALVILTGGAQAFDDSKYPDWKGQWTRAIVPGIPQGNPSFDPTKRRGLAQEAPLTPEYQAIFEANLKDQQAGGHGTETTWTCLPPGMPRAMMTYGPMDFVITPEVTHILIEYIRDNRRVFTDGRDWPAEVEPAFVGYSIGKWIDEDGDGRYDVLEIETRHMKGPRSYDASGLPLHKDNKTIVKERIFLDKNDRMILHDEMTVIDNALTRPWTVLKSYRRDPSPRPIRREYVCAENNSHIRIGSEGYYLSADGYLMPTKKNQPPPDLKYFTQGQ
jgi:hypothetical protein